MYSIKDKLKAENLPINLPINKVEVKILEILKQHPNYTYDQIAQEIDRTRETVRVHLRILEEKSLIKRHGSKKNGYWEILG